MKMPPWTMPKIFTPISVRGDPRYLKYIPTSSPAQLTASANATIRNQPATLRTSNVFVMRTFVPQRTASYYMVSLLKLSAFSAVRAGAGSGRRPDRRRRTARRRRSPSRVAPAPAPRAG